MHSPRCPSALLPVVAPPLWPPAVLAAPASMASSSQPPIPPSASSSTPRSSSHQRNSGPGSNASTDIKKSDSAPAFHHGKSGKSTSTRYRGSRGPKPDSAHGGSRTHPNAQPHTNGGKGRSQSKRSSTQRHSSGYQSEDPAGLAVAPADEFEYGSVFKSGCKKRNFNHLLNFQYEPRGINQRRQQTGEYHARSQGTRRGTRRKDSGHYRPKYKKEQYLQANCQFVVRTDGDYTANLTNPDCIVDWDLVEQVGLKTSGVPSCPICLYPPTAAKIARCGHIFCWSCILHYLALSDYPSRDCPICFVAIFKQDLKSVVSLLHSDYNTGSEIEMRLMRRERSSLFAVPVGQYYPEINKKHPSISMANNSYSQLLLASPFEVANEIIARERSELEEQYRCEKDEPESCFIQEALQYLTQREALIRASKGFTKAKNFESSNLSKVEEMFEIPHPDKPDTIVASSPLSKSPDDDDGQNERPRHLSSSSDGASSVEIEMEDDAITAEDLDLSNLQPANMKEEEGNNSSDALARSNVPKDTFYFYQSADGQPIYLHALNVQMLVHEFGSFENCPSVIKGKIVEKDSTSMSEELRNRLRYLRHLPITSMFEVCELQMSTPAHFSRETLALFKEQIESRRRKRARRARDEKRREKKIQLEEDKLLGKFPGAKLRIESEFHFPEVGRGPSLLDIDHPTLNESFASSRSTESLASVESNFGSGSQGAPWGQVRPQVETIPESGPQPKSFATMLRHGVANPSRTLSRSETFPAPVVPRPANHSDSEPEPEGYVPPPPQAKLGDSLAQALEQFSLNKAQNPVSKENGRKKGKKMKGTKFSLTG